LPAQYPPWQQPKSGRRPSEGSPRRAKNEIGSIYFSLRIPPESRANRAGDRPTVLVKAVLNALADP